MDEVLGKVPLAMAAMARAGGVCPDAALARLPVSEKDLNRRRISWTAFVDFMEPFELACGGPAGLIAGAEAQYPRGAIDLMPVLGLVVSPHAFCRFVHRAVFPRAYGGVVSVRDDDHPDGWFHIHMEIVAPHAGCLPFFRATEGAIRGTPSLFRQSRAEVIAELTPRTAFYRVRLPPVGSLAARARRVLSPRGMAAILDDVESSWIELGDHVDNLRRTKADATGDGFEGRLERVIAKWKMTPRQQAIVAELARGWSNKEIAAHLGCAVHTVELHVTDVLRRTGLPSRSALIAAFWAPDPGD